MLSLTSSSEWLLVPGTACLSLCPARTPASCGSPSTPPWCSAVRHPSPALRGMGDAALRSPATADSAGQEAHTASKAEAREHPGQCLKSRKSERLRQPQRRPGPACSQLPPAPPSAHRGLCLLPGGTPAHHITTFSPTVCCAGDTMAESCLRHQVCPSPRSGCLRSWIAHPPFTESRSIPGAFLGSGR